MRLVWMVKAGACAGFLLSVPFFVLAADTLHVSVQERTDIAIKMRQNTLGSEQWYVCSIETRVCEETASTTPLDGSTSTSAVQWWRPLLPASATWVTSSPDGHWVAFYIAATQSRGMRTFGVLDTTTGKLYTKDQEVSYWDLLTEGERLFAFSPDSRALIYLDDTAGFPTPYRVDLTALQGTTLPGVKMFSRDYSVIDVLWKDNSTILFVANRENPYQWSLYEYALASGALRHIANDVSYGQALRATGSYVLFAQATAQGVKPKLYESATGQVLEFDLPPVETLNTQGVAVTTLKNGLTGVFLLEQSKHSDTLLVWLHGGPYRQTSTGYHPYFSYNGYDWVLEVARRADVGVLKLDYPGSMGFGRLFAESVTGKVGIKDAQDSAAAIQDFAARNGYKNIYLMGNSYGGYLALKLLVDAPTRYKGAMSIAGVTDWTTLLTALSNSIFNVQFGGVADDENNNYAQHAAASIYNKLGTLSGQKVVLIHGDSDTTIPYRQSVGLAEYMRSLGQSVDLITFKGENHVFKQKESFETLCRKTLEFVGRAARASSCVL